MLLRLDMIMMETCEHQTKLHQSSIPVAQFSEAAHENWVAMYLQGECHPPPG